MVGAKADRAPITFTPVGKHSDYWLLCPFVFVFFQNDIELFGFCVYLMKVHFDVGSSNLDQGEVYNIM